MIEHPRLPGFSVQLIVLRETNTVESYFGNEKWDIHSNSLIQAKIDAGDLWAWCQVELIVMSPNGFTESNYLRCVHRFEDEDDFKLSDDYWDLLKETTNDLKTKLMQIHRNSFRDLDKMEDD